MMEITKSFDKKKRDFSSNSNDGDDSKGPRESSLDNSIANATYTDVFTESLKSKEMKKVIQMCEKTKDSQIKG